MSQIPYTVMLFVAGCLLAIVVPSAAFVETIANVSPRILLTLFMPVLITAAAYGFRPDELRTTLPSATLLAVPGMVATMFLVAVTAQWIMGWQWHYAMIFGALISATDPVAVVAILKAQHVDGRLERLIDAEAMLNDGTGIVLFMIALTAVAHPIGELALVVAGGGAIGFIAAMLYRFGAKRLGKVGGVEAQAAIVVAMAYLCYITAHDVLQLSGVLALVVYAVVANYNKAEISPRTRDFIDGVWNFLSLVANTLLFLLIGVVIATKAQPTWADLPKIVAAYVAVNLVRGAVVALLYPALRGTTLREAIVIAWSGLRGAVALALALAVASAQHIPPGVQREILVITGGVIALTLLINATTIKWIIRWTKLAQNQT
ncbi:MAG: cation:proton antiporter [Rikenellaceae bacterium]